MICAYGDAPARFIAHDRRRCLPVCPVHALWRRTWCSRIGGGHGGACKETGDAHVTNLAGVDADEELGKGQMPAGWRSISGCGDLVPKGLRG